MNECASNPDPCDANADCVDTDGSYNCTCRTGFTGNGLFCEGNKINDEIFMQMTGVGILVFYQDPFQINLHFENIKMIFINVQIF